MDVDRKKRLFNKGWTWDEIKHASNVVNQPKEHHTHIKKKLHFTGFWYLMFGLIILNFLVIIFTIPLMLLIPTPWIYIVVIIAGLGCGMVFNWLILEIEHLEHQHHIIALLTIPLLTLLDVIFIYVIVEIIKKSITFNYNPDPVVFYFGLCFILPYFVWFILGKHNSSFKKS
ncbi:hypothetical protein HOC35_04210 [Candidatus Woesearchaeota archaeon]|jgi:hypothetical protein|nr:hypothetical protein [Candidatus Woesearchaeota archaeon]